MLIAGVVIRTEEEKTDSIVEALNAYKDITTYGVHKGDSIVAVFEAESPKQLEAISKDIAADIPGILGVFPVQINIDEENE